LLYISVDGGFRLESLLKDNWCFSLADNRARQ
jgi:hypothetical protein